MARRARKNLLYDGCFVHAYTRALKHERILEDPAEFEKMKELLTAAKAKYSFCIHHYCLMNTHIHLLVSMNKAFEFSRAMQEVKRLYANWLHARRHTYGPIWWGRYGSRLIENETYLYACGLYVERNPVEAGLVAKESDWAYSSARHYLEGTEDSLIDSYSVPSRAEAAQLVSEVQEGQGNVLGTPLFRIHVLEENLLETF